MVKELRGDGQDAEPEVVFEDSQVKVVATVPDG